MKPKLEDLNSCMLFKLREYGLCCMLGDYCDYEEFYNRKSLTLGGSISSLDSYTEDLKDDCGDPDFDIVAVKRMESPAEVIQTILSDNLKKIKWDWEESDDNDEEDSQCSCEKCDCNDTNSYERGEFEELKKTVQKLERKVLRLENEFDF